MANTINRISGNGAASIGTSRTPQPFTQNSSFGMAQPQSEGGDEVQITQAAARLATLGQALSASSPVDDALVARISQALANGTYRISARQVASGLLKSDQALGQLGL